MGPSRRKRQVSDLQALQKLLAHHFDDVEDVMIKLWERPGELFWSPADHIQVTQKLP